VNRGPLDGGMKFTQVLATSATFAVTAFVATIARLAYAIVVLKQTDDKLGTPLDQFVTVAGVHLLATAAATIGFALALRLASSRVHTSRSLMFVTALIGVLTGLISVVEIAKWLEAFIPLSGWADEIVAVMAAGMALGLLVTTLARLRGRRLAV